MWDSVQRGKRVCIYYHFCWCGRNHLVFHLEVTNTFTMHVKKIHHDIFLTEITFLIFVSEILYYSSIHKETKHFFERCSFIWAQYGRLLLQVALKYAKREIYRKFQIELNYEFHLSFGMFLVVNEQVPKYRGFLQGILDDASCILEL